MVKGQTQGEHLRSIYCVCSMARRAWGMGKASIHLAVPAGNRWWLFSFFLLFQKSKDRKHTFLRVGTSGPQASPCKKLRIAGYLVNQDAFHALAIYFRKTSLQTLPCPEASSASQQFLCHLWVHSDTGRYNARPGGSPLSCIPEILRPKSEVFKAL